MSGFKEIIKHSGNYLIANLATKALAFISIPVYTRLLSTAEYGVLSIFLGFVGIIGSLLTLCTDQSISRYYFDQKNAEDFKRFTGTSSVLAISIFTINALIMIAFANEFGKLMGIGRNLIYLMIAFSFINAVGLTFEQIYGPLKKSRSVALSSLFRVYLSFGFSIAIILTLKTDKFYGPIIGQIIGGSILVVYWGKCIKPYFKLSFDRNYLSYIFSYSVPLIPYVLSGVIIEQFGKIALGKTQGASAAGFYSLALTISSIVSIVIAVSHQAWNPYYFEYMNSKNYAQHDDDQNKIFRITIFLAMGVATFGSDVGMLLAEKTFSGSLHLIPIFVLGYVFYQLAYVYMRNFGYTRKTQYLTLTVLLGGLSNVILNSFMIRRFGEIGAAISFTLAYILMALFAWAFNKFLVKHYGAPFRLFLLPILLACPFFIASYFVNSIDSYFLKFLLKIFLTSFLGIILFWRLRDDIRKFIRL